MASLASHKSLPQMLYDWRFPLLNLILNLVCHLSVSLLSPPPCTPTPNSLTMNQLTQNGANKVVISDYAAGPDTSLIDAIQTNIDQVHSFVPPGTLHAVGHVWGTPVDNLLAPLVSPPPTEDFSCGGEGGGKEGIQGKGYSLCFADSSISSCKEQRDQSNDDLCHGHRLEGQEGVEVLEVLPTPALTTGNCSGRRIGGVPLTGQSIEGRKSSNAGVEAQDKGESQEQVVGGAEIGLFDVVVMADLLFNRSQHRQLLMTCRRCLAPYGTAWVSFSHHDPGKASLDLAFFDLAETTLDAGCEVQIEEGGDGGGNKDIRIGSGLEVTLDHQVQMVDLFVEGDGLDKERGMVYVYRMNWHGHEGGAGVGKGVRAGGGSLSSTQ
ncbi:unnamed protein product [Choristocarpus tenellus]